MAVLGGAIVVDSFISGKRGREQRGRRRFLRPSLSNHPVHLRGVGEPFDDVSGGGLRARGNFCTSEWLIDGKCRERGGWWFEFRSDSYAVSRLDIHECHKLGARTMVHYNNLNGIIKFWIIIEIIVCGILLFKFRSLIILLRLYFRCYHLEKM